MSLFKQNCTWTEALSPDPHEPQVMATTFPHKFDTRDTECYRDFVSHSPLILKLMVSLFSVVTAMMAELVVLGSVNLKPRRLSALRKWTVHGAS